MRRYYRDANGRFQIEFEPEADNDPSPHPSIFPLAATLALWTWVAIGLLLLYAQR
jgi:hypothetical protein